MNENRHRTLSLMNDIHPEYVVNVAFGGAKDGIDGKIGKDGEPGKDGAPGEDGFSPIVEAYRNPEDTGIIVRVTDKDGTRETYVQDGASSSSENKPVLYIENESQYTAGYSILKYDPQNIPDGYDNHYLDSTFIMQIVAIGNGEFSNGKRYSAYFAISFAGYSQFAGGGVLPTGITSTFLYGDFKPTFEIRGASNTNRLSLELFDVGKSVEDAGFEDFKPGLDVAIYIHHYSGEIPYDEFAGFFERTNRISPLAIPNPNYKELVNVDRSELFNQRLDDVLRFQNYVSGEFDYTTDTSIRATDIEMSTDGDKPGKISLEAAETSNGQTRIQSGKIWLGDYNSSGDYEKLITLDAINNNWRTYQTIIENGELSLKDFDQGYRTVVISGTSNKPYIDMRSDSNSSTHSIKLQVNGDKGATNIINGQIVLKDESGNKQIDISSRTNGKGIVKLSDKKLLESTKINNTNVVKLFTTDGTNLFTVDSGSRICYGNSLLNTFIGLWNIDTTVPVLPTNPSISVDDSNFYPTGSVDICNPNGNSIMYTNLYRYSSTMHGVQGLMSSMTTTIYGYGNDLLYSNRQYFAYESNGSYNTTDTYYYTYISNSGYADILSAYVNRSQEFDGNNDTGTVELRDAMGNDVLYISTENDDNGYQYTRLQLYIDGGVSDAQIDGDILTRDDRILLGDHKLSDIVTYTETFTNSGSTLQLKNNTIYTASEDISNKSFSYSSGDCIIEFSTSGTGSVTMNFPMTITFDEWPTFGNDEHWIIGIRDGYAVWTMYDISQ